MPTEFRVNSVFHTIQYGISRETLSALVMSILDELRLRIVITNTQARESIYRYCFIPYDSSSVKGRLNISWSCMSYLFVIAPYRQTWSLLFLPGFA